MKRTDPDAAGPNAPLTIGLFQQKSNAGPRHPAVGFSLTFTPDQIHVRRVNLADVDELNAKLPLWQRMSAILRTGEFSVDMIAEPST